VNLFLNTSVILADCDSQSGASRFVFDAAAANDWRLLIRECVLQEVAVNLPLLPEDAATQWTHLRGNVRPGSRVISTRIGGTED
jgi:hypothetical protein